MKCAVVYLHLFRVDIPESSTRQQWGGGEDYFGKWIL